MTSWDPQIIVLQPFSPGAILPPNAQAFSIPSEAVWLTPDGADTYQLIVRKDYPHDVHHSLWSWARCCANIPECAIPWPLVESAIAELKLEEVGEWRLVQNWKIGMLSLTQERLVPMEWAWAGIDGDSAGNALVTSGENVTVQGTAGTAQQGEVRAATIVGLGINADDTGRVVAISADNLYLQYMAKRDGEYDPWSVLAGEFHLLANVMHGTVERHPEQESTLGTGLDHNHAPQIALRSRGGWCQFTHRLMHKPTATHEPTKPARIGGRTRVKPRQHGKQNHWSSSVQWIAPSWKMPCGNVTWQWCCHTTRPNSSHSGAKSVKPALGGARAQGGAAEGSSNSEGSQKPATGANQRITSCQGASACCVAQFHGTEPNLLQRGEWCCSGISNHSPQLETTSLTIGTLTPSPTLWGSSAQWSAPG